MGNEKVKALLQHRLAIELVQWKGVELGIVANSVSLALELAFQKHLMVAVLDDGIILLALELFQKVKGC